MKRNTGYSRELNDAVSGSNYGTESSVNPCDSLVFDSTLQLIQPSISSYALGDALEVVIDTQDIVTAIGQHGLLGTVIDPPSHLKQLIACLKSGKTFKAAITRISSLSCDVRIRPSK